MKVTLESDGKIIVDCEGKAKEDVKSPEIIYVNTKQKPEPKTFEQRLGAIRVSVDTHTRTFPIRISLLSGVHAGLPPNVFNTNGVIPGDVLSIPATKTIIKLLEKAIMVAEANNELQRD